METLPILTINFAGDGLPGIALYNRGLYWESHEAWEAVWHTKKGREWAFYQAMIHVAAAMLKMDRQQFVGAHSQLNRSLQRFSVAGPMETGTNDKEFRASTKACRDELLRCGPEGLSEFDRTLYPRVVVAATEI